MSKGLLRLLWFIGVAFVVLIAFGIGQPFIWQLVNKIPPATTMTLSSLLTIMIGLLALGIAAFGGGTYYILSHRIREEAGKAAEREYFRTIIRLRTHVSALWGRLYEGLQGVIPREQLIAFANQAVRYGKEADLDTQRLDEKTQKDLILGAKNNYAMALALKGDPGTAKTAEELVEYIEQKTEQYPKDRKILLKETIGFVHWRLPRNKEDLETASKIRDSLLADPQIDEVQKEMWKKRWDQFPKSNIKE